MSKEKQIEEVAKVIKSSLEGLGSGNFNFTGDEFSIMLAKAIYASGYRKQSEGEWKKKTTYPMGYTCSKCQNFETYKSPFCRLCGAHMRKEDEGK